MTLEDAIGIATMAHSGQHDKAGEPYILHPLRVMLAVSERSRVIAVLHDVIEDTDFDVPLLEPPRLSWVEWDALDLLTRTGETYAEYIERIATAKGPAGEIAREVKRADLDDNIGRMDGIVTEKAATLSMRYEAALARLDDVRETERV